MVRWLNGRVNLRDTDSAEAPEQLSNQLLNELLNCSDECDEQSPPYIGGIAHHSSSPIVSRGFTSRVPGEGRAAC
jgi:hypothetical protein